MKRVVATASLAAVAFGGTALCAIDGASASSQLPRTVVSTSPAIKTAAVGTSSTATLAAIAKAVRASSLIGAVPASALRVDNIRIRDGWARAIATPRDHRTDPAQVVLRLQHGSWKAVDLGTDGVGCNIAPATVRASLGLWGHC